MTRLLTRARLLLMLAIMFAVLLPPNVKALTTMPTLLPEISSLMVTAYKTSAQGKDIDFLEVYNNGDQLIDVNDWAVVDVANDRTLSVTANYSGKLEPKHHAVAARAGLVDNATYHISGWNKIIAQPKLITTLQLIQPSMRPSEVTVSTKYVDTSMMRSYNTSSYSTTTFELQYRGLFDDGLYVAPSVADGLRIVEIYPYASDCTPFDTSVLCGDYIKLFNASNSPIALDDLVLRTDSSSSTRTSSNTFTLGGTMQPGAYKTIWLNDEDGRISLTNSGGYVWLEDIWGQQRYDQTVQKYENAGTAEQGLSYAQGANGAWQWSTTPQPNAPNLITPRAEIVTDCPIGKYRNPDTGRCRNVEEIVNALAVCPEGQVRNSETNRCRSAASSSSTGLTPCDAGQERNPTTNRCRSIASAVAELIPCDEGQERNPTTNRCRKAATSNMPLAPYPVEPVKNGATNLTAWLVGGLVASAAAGYGVWEWRREINKFSRRLLRIGIDNE